MELVLEYMSFLAGVVTDKFTATKPREPKVRKYHVAFSPLSHSCSVPPSLPSGWLTISIEWQLPGYGRGVPTTLVSTSKSGTGQVQTSTSKSPIPSDSKPQKPNVSIQGGPSPGFKSPVPASRGVARGAFRSRGRGSPSAGRGNSTAVASRNSTRLFRDSPAKAKWRTGSDPTGQ